MQEANIYFHSRPDSIIVFKIFEKQVFNEHPLVGCMVGCSQNFISCIPSIALGPEAFSAVLGQGKEGTCSAVDLIVDYLTTNGWRGREERGLNIYRKT